MNAPPPGERLDSWKAIAEYLHRDVATVARWEKSLALPVRRVEGGRSVFAYTAEIDEWLQRATPNLPIPVAAPPATAAPIWTRVHPWRWAAPALVVLAVAAALFARPWQMRPDDLRVEVTGGGVVARDASGAEQWRYPFPGSDTPGVLAEPVTVTGAQPGIYVATSYRARQAEDALESGALTLLDRQGRAQRSFAFDDTVTFLGKSYGPPWALSAFAVNDDGGGRRVAVAAHHYVWDPGLVTILDDRWQRRGTFVHAGWIEGVRWLGPERLLVAGFSNAYDGGMIALLDPAALDGQGPAPAGSRHVCDSCGPGRPLRMFVFPRTEVNRVSASPFNRARVQTFADGRLFARTLEMETPGAKGRDADVVYEFTPALDLATAEFSDRYWELHVALEADGRITHTRDQCPDRDGPRQVQMWEPSTGWRTVDIP